jgi:hypothetical protein
VKYYFDPNKHRRIMAELDAMLPAILDRAFIRLHVISARREGEL